jgi:hypothetical protein
MNRWRFFLLFGFFRARKQQPVTTAEYLVDGDGAFLTDEDGNKLTG